MKLLALTRYTPLGASSRLRFFQYAEFMKASGFDILFQPFFTDSYLTALYSGKVPLLIIFKAYWNRLKCLYCLGSYPVIWLEKESLPWLPAWLELLFVPSKAKLIVDYDDAWFHRYDRHANPLVRVFLGKKIDRIMARANLVTVGNDYLEQRARQAGAKNIQQLPTVVDLRRYSVHDREKDCSTIVIGWIGSPGTAKYLDFLAPLAEKLSYELPLRFIAVGAHAHQLKVKSFQCIPWTEANEVDLLYGFDIGIMPLPDDEWERGKCGYKLIQYMTCSLPVIASPVGINCKIVEHGNNGYLASSPEEWESSIRALVSDSALRHRMGTSGRKKVEAAYSLQAVGDKLIFYFDNLLSIT